MPKLKTFQARLTSELLDLVDEHGAESNKSRSVIIEDALRAYRPIKKEAAAIPERGETRGRPRKDQEQC